LKSEGLGRPSTPGKLILSDARRNQKPQRTEEAYKGWGGGFISKH